MKVGKMARVYGRLMPYNRIRYLQLLGKQGLVIHRPMGIDICYRYMLQSGQIAKMIRGRWLPGSRGGSSSR